MENFREKNQMKAVISMDKINTWGGSLSIGHPFGATGIRLIAHSATEFEKLM